MAAAALDNANPIILSASQLPTRHKRSAPRKGPDCRYSDLILSKPSYMSRPFLQDDDAQYQLDTAAAVAWSRFGSGAGGADDNLSAEAIDEQEIYGMIATSKHVTPFASLVLRHSLPSSFLFSFLAAFASSVRPTVAVRRFKVSPDVASPGMPDPFCTCHATLNVWGICTTAVAYSVEMRRSRAIGIHWDRKSAVVVFCLL